MIRVLSAVALVALAACAGQEQIQPATGGGGQLFARALDEIGEFYIEPVSSRQVAIAGAARLAKLDNKLAVSDNLGGASVVALSYEDRNLAYYPTPATRTAGLGEHCSKP